MINLSKFSFWQNKDQGLTFLSEEKIIIRKNINILFTFILFLIIVYFLAFFMKKELSNRLISIDKRNQTVSIELAKISKLDSILFINRLESLKKILDNHVYWSNVFTFLEKVTLPNVRYTGFSGDVVSKSISLTVKTADLLSMVKQLIVFENLGEVKSVTFGGVRFLEDGIGFSLKIILSDSVWKKD